MLGLGGWHCEGVRFGKILRVAPGSIGGGGVLTSPIYDVGRREVIMVANAIFMLR